MHDRREVSGESSSVESQLFLRFCDVEKRKGREETPRHRSCIRYAITQFLRIRLYYLKCLAMTGIVKGVLLHVIAVTKIVLPFPYTNSTSSNTYSDNSPSPQDNCNTTQTRSDKSYADNPLCVLAQPCN
jgi:hypothetical protein